MEDGFHSYCDKVCSLIRRPSVQETARKELLAHLEDHAAVLEERGIPADLAARQAVESMGDPYELAASWTAAMILCFPGCPGSWPSLPACSFSLGS